MAGIEIDGRGLGIALRRVSALLLFGVLPILLTLLLLGWTLSGPTFVSDFHGDLYDAGRAILAGHDPYRLAFLDRLAATAGAGIHPPAFAVPVYPAPTLLAATPLALLPFRAAGLLFTATSILAMCAGLRLLGVRDWRCLGAAFLSWPLLHSLRLGQVNELLVLGAALAWRLRQRPLAGPAALVVTIVGKLVLWPLALFPLLTGRRRGTVLIVCAGGVVLLGGWSVLGFAGLRGYPHLLGDLSQIEGGAGVSLLAASRAAGLPAVAGRLLELGVTLGLLALAIRVRSAPGDGEARCFGLLVLAGLSSSSVLWPHYLVLLYIPIALLAPTLSPLWLLPLLTNLAPVEVTGGELLRIAPYLVVELGVAVALCRPLLRLGAAHERAQAAQSCQAIR